VKPNRSFIYFLLGRTSLVKLDLRNKPIVLLIAVPGKCGPLQVSDITKSACRLKWKAPEDDGGSKITHYVVERKETGKPYWTTVASLNKAIQRYCFIYNLKNVWTYVFVIVKII